MADNNEATVAAFNLSVTAQELNDAISKANAAAPQSTTYTKGEVDTKTAAINAAIDDINDKIGNINTILEEVL
jgi:hypothetical protein